MVCVCYEHVVPPSGGGGGEEVKAASSLETSGDVWYRKKIELTTPIP